MNAMKQPMTGEGPAGRPVRVQAQLNEERAPCRSDACYCRFWP